MDFQAAPSRLRTLPTWLVNQLSTTAQRLVNDRFFDVAAHRYQYSMLLALEEFGPSSQADLGRHCGLDRSDVAAAVADLEARRMVEREPDPADRRRNTVRITRTGQRHLGTLDGLVAQAQEQLVAPLTAAERRQLTALLGRLVEHHGTG